ncbi:MAG: DinB family protein [Anaerolineae bacterium]|nr:DinB family protein [Anaerolineae bacterium]
MISSVTAFAEYWQRIHTRTREMVAAIPEESLDWRPAEGEFTCAELVRHIASARRMNVVSATLGEGVYPGHDERFGISRRDLLHYLDASHAEVSNRLAGLRDDDLAEPRVSNQGQPYPAWNILLALVEHEVHHRAQLAMYLTLLGIEPPALFGLHVEKLRTS